MARVSKLFLSFIALIMISACGTTSSSEPNFVHSSTEAPTTTNANTHSTDAHNRHDHLHVHYIDVGQADATLIELSDDDRNYNILIDAGDWNNHDVVTYLDKKDVTHLDILIGTHPHADHIGQMDQILSKFDVTEVWMSGDETTSQTFERVLDAIIESGVSYHEPRAGEVYDIGPLLLEVFNPEELTGDLHEGSISLRVTFGDISFLFTGDAEEQTEQAMINRGDSLKATVLQLGHHGSRTSTTSPFLEAVDPEVAIISAGIQNQYGHPHEEVINRVQRAEIDLFTTFDHGTIIISTDGQTYTIQTNATETSLANSVESKDPVSIIDCIDINDASVTALEEIIHIGPERAMQVVQLRPFETLSDLDQISGLGSARVADIKEENLACIGG
ncbi:MBL fold metallo-hydrolase [Alkalihalobacillus sp. MEB130]|uniref:MBL fold metallo-hydrolase n=1 Tax=Alkalihalobacillus sp. MEB130 TaxID=2976704 RepID=UPI0028DEEF8A|nr:MBL fold metallo-hydrolase [Alkalihalobacillus sp. MEB130]MDT8860109.1 MBL fold metallo-hydrolase [Alkalihalobacillus sp. MEB130]